MADSEHAAAQPAEPHAEREVEAVARAGDQRVGIESFRHDDRREAVRVRTNFLAEDAEAPRADRGANALAEAMMPSEDVVEALGQEHVERLAKSEEHERRGRVRKETRGVVLDDRTPVEEVPRAA